ncbi:MAG: HI0074 family nucleotidyltransferase substrate-binding subunit [Methylohalobius sp. ZOD2]
MLDLGGLEKALHIYRKVVSKAQDAPFMDKLDKIAQQAVRAGAIQHFEFSYELCWKSMRRWLEQNLGRSYVDGVSRRELFRLAAEHQLIESVDRWMFYHRARNLTSHTYHEETAWEVFTVAVEFVTDAEALLAALKQRND